MHWQGGVRWAGQARRILLRLGSAWCGRRGVAKSGVGGKMRQGRQAMERHVSVDVAWWAGEASLDGKAGLGNAGEA